MRKILLFFATLAVGIGFTACVSTESQISLKEIINLVKQKNDPENKAGTVQTAIFRYDCINRAEKSTITILLKRPGKVKIVNNFEGDSDDNFRECAYDGKTAWEYSNKKGLRYFNDSERNEIRLQAFLLSPSINIKKVFKDIKLDGKAEVDKQECWKLTCIPADTFQSQPITVFIDKKTYFIVKIIEEQDTEGGIVKVVTLFRNYKNYKGFLLPELTITKVDDDVTESTLVKMYVNREIADSEFAAPETLE